MPELAVLAVENFDFILPITAGHVKQNNTILLIKMFMIS